MKLASWNINGFVQDRPAAVALQIAEIPALEVDILCLQEVRAESLTVWEAALGEHFQTIRTTAHLVGERHGFLLLAAKGDLEVRPAKRFEVPFAELVLCAVVETPVGPVEVTTTHVPNGSSNGWRKVEHLEGLYRYLARTHDPALPRILCGDFNCPRSEEPDGRVVTWGQDDSGTKVRPDKGQRWDAAERAIVLGLRAFDLTDVYRDTHPYAGVADEQGTWVAKYKGREYPRRFDHVFAARSLEPWSCEYRHDLRRKGVSDHSAVLASFDHANGPKLGVGSPAVVRPTVPQ